MANIECAETVKAKYTEEIQDLLPTQTQSISSKWLWRSAYLITQLAKIGKKQAITLFKKL